MDAVGRQIYENTEERNIMKNILFKIFDTLLCILFFPIAVAFWLILVVLSMSPMLEFWNPPRTRTGGR